MCDPCVDSYTNIPAVKRSFWDKWGNFHMDWVFSKGIIVNFVSWDNDSVVIFWSLFVIGAY